MSRLATIWLPLALLIAWILAALTGFADPLFLPSPWQVAISLYRGLIHGSYAFDLAATLVRSVTGMVIAATIGVPLGLCVGRVPWFARATQPTIDFFRSIPGTALFPLFLFIFGIGDTAKIAIVVYACTLTVLVNTAAGALQVKAARILSARVMGATTGNVFWHIILPESSPGIFVGLRISLSLSLVLVVVTEMFIGTSVGLGYQILNAQLVYRVPDMYAAIVLTGLVGYLANLTLLTAERRFLHWVGK